MPSGPLAPPDASPRPGLGHGRTAGLRIDLQQLPAARGYAHRFAYAAAAAGPARADELAAAARAAVADPAGRHTGRSDVSGPAAARVDAVPAERPDAGCRADSGRRLGATASSGGARGIAAAAAVAGAAPAEQPWGPSATGRLGASRRRAARGVFALARRSARPSPRDPSRTPFRSRATFRHAFVHRKSVMRSVGFGGGGRLIREFGWDGRNGRKGGENKSLPEDALDTGRA